jgi:hypothetical protein
MPTKLTKRTIDAIEAPVKGSVLLRDTEVAGFGIRVQAATRQSCEGKRTFYFNYHAHGVERRITIGHFGPWTCEAARERAKELRKAVDRGEDPALERRERREAPTMRDLADRYKREHLPTKCDTGQATDWRLIETKILPRLGARLVSDIHHGDVTALHTAITKAGTPIRANRTIAVLSKMFSVSMLPQEGDTTPWRTPDLGNPCKGVKRNMYGRGFVVPCARQGQMLDLTRVPFKVPDHIWKVAMEHRDEFPYTRDPRGGDAWRIPWMVK